jgi:alanine racemase
MSRPIRAQLSRSAIQHNYALLKSHAPDARVFAVVKANAYGHGLEFAAKALREADGFATLELDSAIKLREMGMTQPILMLEGFFGDEELAVLDRYRLTTAVPTSAQISAIMKAKLSHPLDVFIKINTGMNRLGFVDGGLRYALGMAAGSRNFGEVTLMTHFASADLKGGVAKPLKLFLHCEKIARETLGDKPFQVSAANSAALLRHPQTHGDWVRPGIALYGSSPFADETAHSLGLKPVMNLTSEIISVQTLERGDTVGYGGTFVAPKKMRIGIVACGYADGYPRHAPGDNTHGTPVMVGGKRTRTVGRVSMDMLMVDITEIAHAVIGTEVALWGESLSIDEVAHAAGTVGYELMCAVAPRVKKVEAG